MHKPATANYVRRHPDGYIEVGYVGDQSGETVRWVTERCLAEAQRSIKADRYVLGLIDLSQVGRTTRDSRAASRESFFIVPSDKVALYGANPFERNLVSTLIRVSGRGLTTGIFKTRAEAVRWLLKPPAEPRV